jgi:hypothetical protein
MKNNRGIDSKSIAGEAPALPGKRMGILQSQNIQSGFAGGDTHPWLLSDRPFGACIRACVSPQKLVRKGIFLGIDIRFEMRGLL